MAKRITNSEILLAILLCMGVVAAFFIGAALLLVKEAPGEVAIALGFFAFVYTGYRGYLSRCAVSRIERRRALLLRKYGDASVVERILSRSYWIGQTAEQLLDSLGTPEDIDQQVLKTKKKEVWKYGHQGSNWFAYRISLDNDVVVGWDEKA